MTFYGPRCWRWEAGFTTSFRMAFVGDSFVSSSLLRASRTFHTKNQSSRSFRHLAVHLLENPARIDGVFQS